MDSTAAVASSKTCRKRKLAKLNGDAEHELPTPKNCKKSEKQKETVSNIGQLFHSLAQKIGKQWCGRGGCCRPKMNKLTKEEILKEAVLYIEQLESHLELFEGKDSMLLSDGKATLLSGSSSEYDCSLMVLDSEKSHTTSQLSLQCSELLSDTVDADNSDLEPGGVFPDSTTKYLEMQVSPQHMYMPLCSGPIMESPVEESSSSLINNADIFIGSFSPFSRPEYNLPSSDTNKSHWEFDKE